MNSIPFSKNLVGVGVAIALAAGSIACSDGTSTTESRDQSSDVRTMNGDSALSSVVQARLAREALIESADIQVTSANGVVTLRGAVDSSDAKSAAESAANSVEGVSRVDNQLIASRTSERMNTGRQDDNQRSAGQQAASDALITTKVKSMLLADSVSQGMDISVETRDGIVSLEGSLDNQDDIEHVSDIARDVEGVLDVDAVRLTVARQY